MGSKETPMGSMSSKRTSRRDLLKGGATLAGGLTLGVPVHAQEHDHSMAPASGSASAVAPLAPAKYKRWQRPIGGREVLSGFSEGLSED